MTREDPSATSRVLLAAVVLLLGGLALLPLKPPAPVSDAAPDTEFSADRALSRLPSIADTARPSGSDAAATVREYLEGELTSLGLDTEVRTAVARRTVADRPTMGTVSNVYAQLPPDNTSDNNRILLVAHYDSVPSGPGASDNGVNVAAVLETVRALQAGPAPGSTIAVLFTDAEEQGLLGAQAFVEADDASLFDSTVIVNLEARGVRGPAVMFQMAGSGLAPALTTGQPTTTSLADTVFEALPNDTDLSVFEQAGMRGLNFAFFDGSAHYHTPHDDARNVNPSSVQSMGESVLSTVRALDAHALASDSAATYFSLFGSVVAYPAQLDAPLAIIAVLGYGLLLWTCRRYGIAPASIARPAAGLAGVLVGAAITGFGGWSLLAWWRPDLLLSLGDVYRPAPYLLAEMMAMLGVLVAWHHWSHRNSSPEAVTAAVLGWLTATALAMALFAPGGAYLFIWPSLFGIAALALGLRFGRHRLVRLLRCSGAALPAVVLIVPIAVLVTPALGLALSVVPLLLVAMAAATLSGVLAGPLPRRVWVFALMVPLIASLVTLRLTALSSEYDAQRPQSVSLAYLLDTDANEALWISDGLPTQPHVGPLLTDGDIYRDDIVDRQGAALSSGPAPLVELQQPEIETVRTEQVGDERVLHLDVHSPPTAYSIDITADDGQRITEATVNSQPLPAGSDAQPWSVRYVAPGDAVRLVLRVRSSAPLDLRVVSTAAELPPAADPPQLPPEASWLGWPGLSGQTIIVRTITV